MRGLQWVSVCCIRRGGNRVAHVLAQYARNTLDEDVYWMEDSPHQQLMLCIMTFHFFNEHSPLKKKQQ